METFIFLKIYIIYLIWPFENNKNNYLKKDSNKLIFFLKKNNNKDQNNNNFFNNYCYKLLLNTLNLYIKHNLINFF